MNAMECWSIGVMEYWSNGVLAPMKFEKKISPGKNFGFDGIRSVIT
jgi:hypothetical protein